MTVQQRILGMQSLAVSN